MTATRAGARRVDLDALAELEDQRDLLLRSLDDLERERAAGELDDDDYARLRDDYTARAAQVLRAIEDGRAALPQPAPRRRSRTWLAALGVAVVAGLAGVAVAASSGTRLPGETATGGLRPNSNQVLQQAAQLYQQGEALQAIQAYDEVLADDPDHPAALAYKGWLLVDVGAGGGQPELIDRGEALLRRSAAADPTYPDAHFFLGMLALQVRSDTDAALEQFRTVLDLDAPASMTGPAQMVVGDIEAGGDGIPDGPPPTSPPTSAPAS